MVFILDFSMSNAQAVRMGDRDKCDSNMADQNTSDEHIDPYCEPCVKDKKRRIAARGLCQECNTFVCQQCLEAHFRWPKLRNHTILKSDEMPRSKAEKPAKFPECEIHRENVNDQFCLDHHKMLCSQCIKSYHGTCRQTAIHELCKTLGKAEIGKFRDLIQNSERTAKSVQLMIKHNKDAIEIDRQTMIKEADDWKQRLDTKIQLIAVDKSYINETCRQKSVLLDDQKDAAANAIQSLQHNISALDEFDGDNVTLNMFIALQKIAEYTNTVHRQLNDVSNQHRNVRVSFVPDAAMSNFLSSTNEIGEIKEDTTNPDSMETLPEITFPPKPPTKSGSQRLEAINRMHLYFLLAYLFVYFPLLFQPYPAAVKDLWGVPNTKLRTCDISNIALNKKSSVDVKLDGHTATIPGMVVTSNGTLLLTDYINKKVKVFTSKGGFLSSLELSDKPHAIALINSTTAVLSTMNRKLHFLNLSLPSVLSVHGSVSLIFNIYDLAVYNNKLIVTTWFETKGVKMLDLEGHEIWSTSLDSIGEQHLPYLAFVITRVINNTETVIVTDVNNDQIVFLDANNGKRIKTINETGRGPRGLAVDHDGNVYICYRTTSEISVWSPDFSRIRILLTNRQLQGKPLSIVYSRVTGELFISYFQSNVVDRFQVTCKSRTNRQR